MSQMMMMMSDPPSGHSQATSTADGPGISSPPQERRPPLYSAEDYVNSLKRFCKFTGLQMYLQDPPMSEPPSEFVSSNNRKNAATGPAAGAGGKSTLSKLKPPSEEMRERSSDEMGLRQFGTVTELLAKLKADLTLSFPSFMREFVGEAHDGVTLLLDLLKAVQLSQTNITGSLNQLGSRANHVMFKRALADEFEALLCLKQCAKTEDGALRLVDHPSGLFTVAVCVMSNYSKSRVLSLQLLARLCEMNQGHKQVSDAISMLRLRFGEPVRFKFLIGMLNSYNSPVFQIACLRFLNKFVETSGDTRERVMIQTELEEAGFDILPLRKTLLHSLPPGMTRGSELLKEELLRWETNYIDVNTMARKLSEAERENDRLRLELEDLRVRHQSAVEERQRSLHTVDRLRECCDHLQNEIDKSFHQSSTLQKKKAAVPKPPRLFSPNQNVSLAMEKMRSSQTQTKAYALRQKHNVDEDEDDVDLEGDIEEEDDDGDDVLLLLPAAAMSGLEKGSKGSPNAILNKKGSFVSASNVSITAPDSSSHRGSMVTVLATDGYTCITSPVPAPASAPVIASTSTAASQTLAVSVGKPKATKASGDSGLSSEEMSSSAASPSHNRAQSAASSASSSEVLQRAAPAALRSYNSDSSDKSSYSEKAETERAKETVEDRLQGANLDHGVDIDESTYVERNALQEEATTVEAERISIDRFRQRFLQASSESSPDSFSGSRVEQQQQQHSSSGAKQINGLLPENSGMATATVAAGGPTEASESYIVPRRAPRPPARSKRPKSTPPPGKAKISLEKSREDTFPEEDELQPSRRPEPKEVTSSSSIDEEEANLQKEIDDIYNSSNALLASTAQNTLESVSARSFGFVKPTNRQRENDLKSRLRRHKSFFTPDSQGSYNLPQMQQLPHYKKKGFGMRRAESFQHSRSMSDLHGSQMDPASDGGSGSRLSNVLRARQMIQDHIRMQHQQHRGKSVERLLSSEAVPSKPLSKSKSMEFLKAKLLSRKPSTKLQLAPFASSDWEAGGDPQSNVKGGSSRFLGSSLTSLEQGKPGIGPGKRDYLLHASKSSSSSSSGGNKSEDSQGKMSNASGGSAIYDWRQDTPFWNKTGRWARPAPVPKKIIPGKRIEEPWVNHHHPVIAQMPLQQPGPVPAVAAGPNGWPGHQQYLLGRKLGSLYPSIPVYLPPRMQPPPPVSVNHMASSMSPAGASASEELLTSRLEITELSDGDDEVAERCPTPDYSTLQTKEEGPSSLLRDQQHHQHHQHQQQQQPRRILDMPSGLY